MNQFGLGLVLNFTDNASAGMQHAASVLLDLQGTADNVSQSLMGMYAASQNLVQIGSLFESQGKTIVGSLVEVGRQVIDTGQQFTNYRMSLRALYGEDAYESILGDITDYARESVFELQDVIQSVVMLKAAGIDALNNVVSTSGVLDQKILDYASDIAAMVPGLRTAGGTGVKGAMYAVKEYIAEGNAMTLKRGASLDILSIIGEEKGATAEDRARQVADMVEKLGIGGYTASLFEASPSAKMSNWVDYLDVFKKTIAESGPFEAYQNIVFRVSDMLDRIFSDSERFEKLTTIIGKSLTSLISPLEKVLDFVDKNIDAWLNWATENAEVVESLTKVTAVVGTVLFGLGSVMKLTGSLLPLLLTVVTLFAKSKGGLLSLILGTGKDVKGKVKLFGVFSAILGTVFKDTEKGLDIVATLEKGISKLFNFTITKGSALENTAIRFFSIITNKGLLMFSVLAMGASLVANDTWGIREAFVNVIKFIINTIKILVDAFDDTLSDENFNLAQQMGILPFVEAFIKAKRVVQSFFSGLLKGFSEFFEQFNLDLTNSDTLLGSLLGNFGQIVSDLIGSSETATQKAEKFGEVIGSILPKIMLLIVGINLVIKVVSIVVGVITTVGKVISTVISIAKGIITVVKTIGSVLSTAITFLMAHPVVTLIVAIAAAVIALAVVIYKNWDKIKKWLSKAADWINDKVIQPIATFFTNLWNGIKTTLSTVAQWIYTKVIIPVVNFFINLLNTIVGIVYVLWNKIVAFVTPIAQWVYDNLISPVIQFFVNLWNSIVSIAQSIVNGIVEIWGVVSSWVYENLIAPIVQFFTQLWEDISAIVQQVSDFISEVWGVIATWVNENIVTPIVDFFNSMYESISQIFGQVKDAITGAFQEAWDFVTGLWSGISDFFSGVWDSVTGFFSGFTSIGESITGISTIPAAANGVENFAGGLMQINESGGELVNLPNGTTVIPHDESVLEAMKMGAKSVADYFIASIPKQQSVSTAQAPVEHNDYQINFTSGSIIVKCDSTKDSDLEKTADKLYKIIKRKLELEAIAKRNSAVSFAVT